MDNAFKVKQITKLYDSCNQCGLPTLTCICNMVTPINSRAKFWVLTSEREFSRPSSTGRLLKLINPLSTEIFLWERTKPSQKLIEMMTNFKGNTYLLFPSENEDFESKSLSNLQEETNAFILIDGTWKEARKIFRKCDYLKSIPQISIKPDYESEFTLRRGRLQKTLCTIEAAMEILKSTGETEQQRIVEQYFNLFLKHYKAGANSHLPKD
ncbi:DTW domain containing protein [Desulfosporosinus sp. HMP52]|uniref:tRNA-uridine aminocarboxypropyltransferase n=1 Tax=Desulfosporosinus sp. HMP52 TaxID=1487923 RepID=UPI00051F9ECF|nr:tRNA-uridine aminocarboxypropyltransferase [Desulfosporosinus sp. HMP52]KGK88104.1 DTW domain containing protein [Desulfosporosinus sp. HMP52]